jgi:hypothetical protein
LCRTSHGGAGVEFTPRHVNSALVTSNFGLFA